MAINFFLLTSPEKVAWAQVLRQALASLGTLEIVWEEEAEEHICQQEGKAVIIIDAGAVRDAPALVAHLRQKCPTNPIIVATASPTWRRAREVFLAGATDYIRKSWNVEEIRDKLKEILDTSLPRE